MTLPRYILLLLVVTLFAVLGVAQRTHVIHLGYRLDGLQEDWTLFADQNRRLVCDISALSHPARIAREITRSKIALMNPVALTQTSEGEVPEQPDRAWVVGR